MAIYYITPIRTTTNAMGRTQYSSIIESYGISDAAIIPSYTDRDLAAGTIPAGKKVGDPIFSWCLVIIPSGSNTTALDADIASGTLNADRLPITTLDVPINSLTQAQRNTLQTIGAKYGVTSIANIKPTDTCRMALTQIGQTLDPAFDASTFATAP